MKKQFGVDLVTHSFEQGERILAQRSETYRKQHGQIFTPPDIARFMARQLGPIKSGDRILDPAIGSGVLACAIIDYVITQEQPLEFWLDGYEIDAELCQVARKLLKQAVEYAASYGITVHARIYQEDFVLTSVTPSQPYLFLADSSERSNKHTLYSHIIANPPYFKLNSNDPRVAAVVGQFQGYTNIYTLFISLAVKRLVQQGRACFIVPRSFCSGRYFSSFRKEFIQEALPSAIHLFDSRQDTFKNASVLQENIIFTFRRRSVRSSQLPATTHLSISASKDTSKLNSTAPISRQISIKQFVGQRYGTLFFRLPTGELDEQIVEMVDRWTGSLSQYGLNVSTGPVVAFRARSWLTGTEAVLQNRAVPLLWMHNVKAQQVEWPVVKGNKPQAISLTPEAQPLLLPVRNYVLLRRFSAKEEARRLIAAPFLANQHHYRWIGLENHLNYIYRETLELQVEEAIGLSALFNSALLDRYFRIINGNTQVNAVELRALPLPPLEVIQELGRNIHTNGLGNSPDIDAVTYSMLQNSGYLSSDFPLIRETRLTMGKIQEAQDILKTLGLPPAQQGSILKIV